MFSLQKVVVGGKMLEAEDFVGDERHEDVPTNFLRQGLLNKRMRATVFTSMLSYSSWKIRNFNLNADHNLEFWLGDIGTSKLQGTVCVIGAVVQRLDPSVDSDCDGRQNCFRLTPAPGLGDGRPIILNASSAIEADGWVRCLQEASKAEAGILRSDYSKPKSHGTTRSTKFIDLTPDED